MGKYTGIDVSGETLDVAFIDIEGKTQWLQVGNNLKGFKKLLKFAPQDHTLVMEASGPYYVQLATYLYSQGRAVCVVNPLKIRRYSQMLFNRAKTDRKDAEVIATYAAIDNPKLWQPNDKTITEMQQIITALGSIDKQLNINGNQLKAFEATGAVCPQVLKSLKAIIRTLKNQQTQLQKQLQALSKQEYSETMKLLMSIPGIGKKTAALLIALTNNFQKFSHYKQLIAYVGLSPRIYQSGTSVKGKGHVCKMGNPKARKFLYMCSWSAKRFNQACKEMYDRLSGKGKPEKVIKIAIANKLLKQAFAVVTKQQPFDKNYQPKVCF